MRYREYAWVRCLQKLADGIAVGNGKAFVSLVTIFLLGSALLSPDLCTEHSVDVKRLTSLHSSVIINFATSGE